MPFSIVQQPNAISFSATLKDVVISTTSNIAITLKDKTTSAVILAESYIPDLSNLVYIRNLGKVVEQIIDPVALVSSYTFTITDDAANTLSFDFTVQYGTTEVADSYTTFIENCFLTTLQGDKKTSMERKEYVSLKVSTDTDVKAAVRYSQDGAVSGAVVLKTVHAADGIVTLDVSPSLFAVAGKTIERFSIIAGNRIQNFIVDNVSPVGAVAFIFINSFGVKETFTCQGFSERENKYDGSLYGTNDGTYRKFFTKLVKQFTGNAGILSQAEADWIEDMFMSNSIYLYNASVLGKEVAVIDPSVKRTSDPTELPSVSFTYRYTQENQQLFTHNVKNRIFDTTFDYSFN